MSKANVGDTIRFTYGKSVRDLTDGNTYTVLEGDTYCVRVRDDAGDDNWIDDDDYEIVSSSSNDELDELRAFKAAALARFPALAEPETDDAAADRFADAHYGSYGSVSEIILKAIKWARANPR